jgi:LytS/YehU family sensor histidine kinase
MATIMVLAISTSLAMIQRWGDDARNREKIEKQQIAAELAVLKAQINPHFFFNTLNNIYSLTFSDIPVSREALLTLSRMMRYVLYDTLHDSALISQEISFIKDYVSLMKLRLHACTKLEFDEPGTDGEYMIAPMLLLPFIENAFKHGSSAMQEAQIGIDLQIKKGILELRVVNDMSFEKSGYNLNRGGIGLANTKKRLNLLYPDNHILVIHQNQELKRYEVILTINVQKKPVESLENEIELHNS